MEVRENKLGNGVKLANLAKENEALKAKLADANQADAILGNQRSVSEVLLWQNIHAIETLGHIEGIVEGLKESKVSVIECERRHAAGADPPDGMTFGLGDKAAVKARGKMATVLASISVLLLSVAAAVAVVAVIWRHWPGATP